MSHRTLCEMGKALGMWIHHTGVASTPLRSPCAINPAQTRPPNPQPVAVLQSTLFPSLLLLLLLPLTLSIVSPQSVLSETNPCRILLVAVQAFLTSTSVPDHWAAIWRDQMIPVAVEL